MDSRGISFTSSYYMLLLICCLLYAPLPSSSSRVAFKTTKQSEKVSLVLYYETLCPYCSRFIVNGLSKLSDAGFNSIVDLRLVPYGNAKIKTNDTITCQHGPAECLLNTVEACAINVWPELSEHFPFIYCVEDLVYEGKYTEWLQCFDKLSLDSEPVLDCYNSGYGHKLELQHAAETNSLQPPHQYVPWVVVDGQPLYEDYENFVSYVCKAYNGTAVPNACSEASYRSIQKEKENHIRPVCYSEETEESTLSNRIRSVISSWIRRMNIAVSM